jgi:hypothetical protein
MRKPRAEPESAFGAATQLVPCTTRICPGVSYTIFRVSLPTGTIGAKLSVQVMKSAEFAGPH